MVEFVVQYRNCNILYEVGKRFENDFFRQSIFKTDKRFPKYIYRYKFTVLYDSDHFTCDGDRATELSILLFDY